MDWSNAALGFLAGFALATAICLVLWRMSKAETAAAARALVLEVKDSFRALSSDALRQSGETLEAGTRRLLETERALTVKDLEKQKEVVAEKMTGVDGAVREAVRLLGDLRKERAEQFSKLGEQLGGLSQQTRTLGDGTARLNTLLSSSQTRGQWGERMAADVLTAAGMVDSVNYLTQKGDGEGGRPDFTFLLPENKKLHMDVKFPLDNYGRYLDSDDDESRTRLMTQFMRDVRERVKELTRREYIATDQGTLDFVLMFVPNEGLFRLIMEQDHDMFEFAMSRKVVLCSPFSLFALLGIVRHSVQTFALQERSHEILSLLSGFRKQWDKFQDKLDMVGRRIEDSQRAFGELTSTRKTQLQKQLDKIDDVRLSKATEEDEK
jgi:DNA recombination protein RmuC